MGSCRRLAKSGQGLTFKAVDRLDPVNGEYVLKVLKSPDDDKARERFRQEIDLAAKLEHPNIVETMDARFDVATPFLVTRFCSGGPLTPESVSKQSMLERLQIFRKVCSAVAYAHEKGVIHRDLKPGNIFLELAGNTNEPRVGDFGIAFYRGDDELDSERLTSVMEAVGARHFIPPEAEIGRVDDVKASFDVYSLGKLLYWLMSGGRFLPREAFNAEHLDLRQTQPGHAMHFVYDVIAGSVVDNPAKRYQNGSQMLEAIEPVIAAMESEARYLDCLIPQQCVFCKNGTYEFGADPYVGPGGFKFNMSRRVGIEFRDSEGQPLHGQPTNRASYVGVLIAGCSTCGNMQQFNILFKLNGSTGKHEPETKWRNLPEPIED